MKILLDTCTFVWIITDADEFKRHAEMADRGEFAKIAEEILQKKIKT